ncbi:MAG: hypothetical protein M3R04_08575, partial [bacterium]|nr:hypothetical protein [bacterium]
MKVKKVLAAQEGRISELSTALESSYSATTLLERQVEDLLYIDLSSGGVPGAIDTVVTDDQRIKVLSRIRRLRHEHPIAKQAVKLTKRFVFGKGIGYVIEDDATREIIDAFWNDPVNQAIYTSHQAMVLRFDETLTDGEFVFVLFESDVAPYVRMGTFPIEQLRDTLYDPENDQIPVWYKRVYAKKSFDPTGNDGQGVWTVDPKPTIRYYRDFRIDDDRLALIEANGLTIPEDMVAEGKVK